MSEPLTPTEGVRRELRRVINEYIAGDRNPKRQSPATDGWFGPSSVTWLVHGDSAMLIGGVQSLLIQTLHPPTMAGVADHSNYKEDPYGRLHRTGNFIGVTTYGSADEAERIVERVKKIHNRVTGTTPSGQPYEANDPHNLAWVHCTEVDAFLRGFQRYGSVSISDDEADQYVEEMARVGEALGVLDAPRSVDELDARLESYRPELSYDAQARETVRWLLFPPNKLAAQAPYAVIITAAINLLPSWARRKLWIPPRVPVVSNAVATPGAKALMGAFRWVMDPAPEIEALRDARR